MPEPYTVTNPSKTNKQYKTPTIFYQTGKQTRNLVRLLL